MNAKIPGLLVVGLLAAPTRAGAADVVTPSGGGITAGVITTLHSAETHDEHSASFVGAPTSLSQSAHSLSGSLSSDYVTGNTSIDAGWTTPDQGSVEFHLDGSIQATCCGNAVYNTTPSNEGLDDWHYTFVPTTNAVFRLQYTLTGNGFGSGGYRLSINGVNAANYATPIDGTTATGSQDFPLVAGQTYTFSLKNFAGFSTTGTGSFTSSGVLSFTILPPDPADMLDDLIQDVVDLNLESGVGNALESKLRNALARAEAGDTQAALALLEAFINSVEAQRGKTLTDAQADALIAAAQAIIDSLTQP